VKGAWVQWGAQWWELLRSRLVASRRGLECRSGLKGSSGSARYSCCVPILNATSKSAVSCFFASGLGFQGYQCHKRFGTERARLALTRRSSYGCILGLEPEACLSFTIHIATSTSVIAVHIRLHFCSNTSRVNASNLATRCKYLPTLASLSMDKAQHLACQKASLNLCLILSY
jgi:hypothetical protein